MKVSSVIVTLPALASAVPCSTTVSNGWVVNFKRATDTQVALAPVQTGTWVWNASASIWGAWTGTIAPTPTAFTPLGSVEPSLSSEVLMLNLNSTSTLASSNNTTLTTSGVVISSTPLLARTATVDAPRFQASVDSTEGRTSCTSNYTFFQGDGSAASGWPPESAWVSFDTLWKQNAGLIGTGCVGGVTPNTANETASIRAGIEMIAGMSGLDHRLILAVIMQESNGCVRVGTTYSPGAGVRNPGLMQDHNGQATCEGLALCDSSMIVQMIAEGVMGTAGWSGGDGLVQTLNTNQGFQGAEAYYRAARGYNSGSVDPSGDLGQGVATHCYASDIANRLLGWTADMGRTCTLDG